MATATPGTSHALRASRTSASTAAASTASAARSAGTAAKARRPAQQVAIRILDLPGRAGPFPDAPHPADVRIIPVALSAVKPASAQAGADWPGAPARDIVFPRRRSGPEAPLPSEDANVLPPALPELRTPRGLRVPLRRRDAAGPPRRPPPPAPPRALVPPPRLPPLAARRARRAHQRGAAHRLARGGDAVSPAGPSPPRPGCLADPARPVHLTFEDRTVPAAAGQSVAAALYAAGVRVFSRSFKYHRPRGLFCVAGDCPN